MEPSAVAGALGAFGMFAPGLAEVRRMDPSDPEAVADVRLGELFGLTWSFGVVTLIAVQGKSAKPYLWWAIGAGLLVGVWESFLRAPHREQAS